MVDILLGMAANLVTGQIIVFHKGMLHNWTHFFGWWSNDGIHGWTMVLLLHMVDRFVVWGGI